MSDNIKFYTVKELKELLGPLSDDTPVVAAPLNENVRVALNVSVVKNAKLGEYTGDVLLFDTGLFDIATNKEIILSAAKVDSDEQGNS